MNEKDKEGQCFSVMNGVWLGQPSLNSRGAIHIDYNANKGPWCCPTQQPFKLDNQWAPISLLSTKNSKGSTKSKSLS